LKGNKKILESDYPQDEAPEYFAGSGAKNLPESFRDYILPHPEL